MNGPYRRPQVDLYTVLLAVALAAVILAAIFAYLETSDYGEQKYRGAPTVFHVDRLPFAPCLVAFDGLSPTDQRTRDVGLL